MVFGTGLLTPDVQVCAGGLLDELDVHPHPARLWCSLVLLLLCSARWTRACTSNSAPKQHIANGLQLRLEPGNVVTGEGERGESGSWRLDG